MRPSVKRRSRLTLAAGICCALLSHPSAFRLCQANPGLGSRDLPVLSNALQVRQLSPEEANRGYPVRFQAVVTYYDASWHTLFVQDSTAGIYVAQGQDALPLRSGHLIELSGIAAPGDFSPVVTQPRIRVIGTSDPPQPQKAGLAELKTGSLDCHWVELTGIVRSAVPSNGRLSLELATSEGSIEVLVMEFKLNETSRLVDSRVKIQGVCSTTSNQKHQVVAVKLAVPGMKNIGILEAGPVDPFSLPVRAISELTRSRIEEFRGHRVRIRGFAKIQHGRDLLWLRDETGSVLVRLEQAFPFLNGDHIDLVGFPDVAASQAVLEHASPRVVDSSEGPYKSAMGEEVAPSQNTAQRRPELPLLSHVGEVRSLRPEKANLGYPVHLRGVVTYAEKNWASFFVQDSSGGIFVQSGDQVPRVKRGDLIELEGVSRPGDFAPIVFARELHILGTAPDPPALPATSDQMFSGREDSQWIEVRGVVRTAKQDSDQLFLEVVSGGRRFNVVISDIQGAGNPMQLVDAEVTLHGVCGAYFNQKRQLTGINFQVPSLKDVRVDQPAPNDLSSLPLRSIGSLMQFTPQASIGHRMRVQGQVMCARSDGMTVIKNEDSGLVIQTIQPYPLQVGEWIEAYGFPALSENRPILEDAYIQNLGIRTMPSPLPVRADAVLAGAYDTDLVKVEGRLLDRILRSNELVLVIQERGTIFNVHLEGSDSQALYASLRNGSRLQVTGVCMVQTDQHQTPLSYRVLLRFPKDVVVLEQPSWWTLGHAIWTVSGMVVFVLFALVWVLFLKQRVRRQTEVIRARLEREASLEARYRELVENANDIIFTCDLRGRFTSLNRAGEQITGFSRSEALQMRVYDLLPEYEREYTREWMKRELAGEKSAAREIVIVTKNGKYRTLEVVTQLIHQGSEAVGIQGIARDITVRKHTEKELLHAKEAAEAANHAKSQFLANMSHEIRTPMNGIVGMAELLLSTELTEEQQEYLGMVKASAYSLTAIINDILDFSKVEAGKMELEPIPFSLRDSLDETLKAFSLRAHEKGLELACRIPPEVPDRVVGDPGRLRQILINLIGNSIKFTQKGEVVVEVSLDFPKDGGTMAPGTSALLTAMRGRGEAGAPIPDFHPPRTCWVQFLVRDTGIGIPADKQKLIFEAFTQADGSTTRRFGGTGLGLTISSKLVELMSGKLRLRSEVGKGSSFAFTACFGVDPQEVNTLDSPGAPALESLPILVVDDNETSRKILEEFLRHWGMQPIIVESGPAALLQLSRAWERSETIPLVLLDHQMPVMDGLTVAEQINRTSGFEGIRIILLTSAGEAIEPDRYQHLGISACLLKPVSPSDLLQTLLAVLGRFDPISAVSTHPLEVKKRGVHPQILLAEDNLINQRLVVRLLERKGYIVKVTNNGQEVLQALQEESFDLVLMDVQMPEMNGLEATLAIRETEKATGAHLPIIALTAHALKGDHERCLEAGMDGYLSKPIQPKELFTLVESHLSRPCTDTQPTPFAETVWDQGQALEQLEGDLDLLKELANLYLEEGPRLISAIRMALAHGDARNVERYAHSLKGALSNLYAPGAVDCAFRLETLGRQSNLPPAWTALEDLHAEIERLEPQLSSLVQKVLPDPASIERRPGL